MLLLLQIKEIYKFQLFDAEALTVDGMNSLVSTLYILEKRSILIILLKNGNLSIKY